MFTLDSNSKSKICAKEYWYKHKLYNSILLLSFRILYLSLGYVKTKKSRCVIVSGGRFERSSSYGGQRYDRDGRDRTHSASDRDGNGGNHNNTTGQQRQVRSLW